MGVDLPSYEDGQDSGGGSVDVFDMSISYDKKERQSGSKANHIQTKASKEDKGAFHSEEESKGECVESNTSEKSKEALNTSLLKQRLEYCGLVLKTLKKSRDAHPFLEPVDPIALGIPDYPEVIKKPMDLGTIEKKLDKNEYSCSEDFAADVKLVFQNCYKYNPKYDGVYVMGENLEKVFDKMMKRLPNKIDTDDVNGGKESVEETVERTSRLTKRRRSYSPTMSEYSTPTYGRRNTIPGDQKSPNYPRKPQPKSTPGTSGSSKSVKSSVTQEASEMKHISNIIRDFFKKQYVTTTWPFLKPVDPVALRIPNYFEVIKKPMDLGTIKNKLNARSYSNAEEVVSDFKLMCNNCYTYNPSNSDVVQQCRDMENIFNEKWSSREVMIGGHCKGGHDDYDDVEERIQQKTMQMHILQNEINELMNLKSSMRSVSSSPSISSAKKKKTPSRRDPSIGKTSSLRPMSLDDKRQLSVDINELPPDKLVRVVEIIKASIPSIKDSAENGEIEIDVELLDLKALNMLYNYVQECRMESDKNKKGTRMEESALIDLESSSSSSEEDYE